MPVTMPARADLKAELTQRRLTQTAVAARMGITRFYLCNLLAGKKPWTRRTAREFSMATGIPLSVIMPEGNQSEREPEIARA